MTADPRLHASSSRAGAADAGEQTCFADLKSNVSLERQQFEALESEHQRLKVDFARREAELAESQERLCFSQEAGRLGFWNLDIDTMRLVASERCKENFGRSRSEPFSYEEWIEAVHPDDRMRMRGEKTASIAGRTDYDIEYRITTPSGEVRWIQSRGRAAYGPDGTPLRMTGISLDITDRKRAEEHRDILSLELVHRVKNTMATIQSIVRQTLRQAPSLEDAMRTIESRIQSLAAAHDVLMRDNWQDATLDEVVNVALRPFGIEQHRRFAASGPVVALPSRHALAFAMALHELATNAVKYGALSNETGRVVLSWDFLDRSNPERLRLEWLEVGGPKVRPPNRRGFGSRIIGGVLASEIGGTSEIDYCPRGVRFTAEAHLLAVPVARERPAGWASAG